MNNLFKNLAIWLVIGIVLMTVFNQFNTRQVAQSSMEYSQFLEEVKAGRIAKVVIQGRVLEATTTEGKKITSYAPPDLWLVSDLLKNNVKVVAKPEEEQSFLMSIFVSWFPMLLLIGVWVFFMRQMQGGGRGGAFSFGKRGRACSTNRPIPSPSPTSPVATRPRKKFPNWSISCATRPSSRSSAGAFPRAC